MQDQHAYGGHAPAILIVDDDPGIRKMLSRLVERVGFEALTAATGDEGFNTLSAQQDRVALVFLDLRMPEMDGFGFRALQLAAGRLEAVPVVVMTGHPVSDEDVLRLRPAAWVTKPSGLARFTDAVQSHARRLPGMGRSTNVA